MFADEYPALRWVVNRVEVVSLMAVVSINRLNAQSGDERSLALTEVYRVVLDDANTSLPDIVNHPDMPQPGQPHPDYNYLFVLDRKPDQNPDSRLVRDFGVEYGQYTFDDDTIQKILQGGDPVTLTQPENRPPVYAWRTVEVQKPLRYHRCTTRNGEVRNGSGLLAEIATGKLIRNTAMIPYEPPGTYRSFMRVLSVRRFESSYDDDVATSILFHANSSTFAGKPEYTVICTQFDAETVWVNDGGSEPRLLYLVNYLFEHDPDGHWVDLPNVSAMEFDGSEYTWITDSNGDKVAHPVFLDETGAAMAAGDVEDEETVIRTYPYEETDLNVLGITGAP